MSPESAEKHSGSSQKQGAGNNQDWALPHDWEKDVAMGVAKVETVAVRENRGGSSEGAADIRQMV